MLAKIKRNADSLTNFAFGSYLFGGLLFLFGNTADESILSTLIGLFLIVAANIACLFAVPAFVVSVFLSFVLARNKWLLSLGILTLVELIACYSLIGGQPQWFYWIVLPYLFTIIALPAAWFLFLKKRSDVAASRRVASDNRSR